MILVTGASGNVGRCVVGQLLADGERVRVLTRKSSTAEFPAGVEVATGDLSRPDDLVDVFDGVDRMFLFTPPTGGGSAADVARRHGVDRVVLLSSIAAQKADPATNVIAARHCAAERAVIDSGLSWTFLRPDTFASNALEWADSIRSSGIVRAPYGMSRRCPIHEQDIAAVAVIALREPGHDKAAYWLTGPEAITVIDQVNAISEAIGKSIRFEELERDEALQMMTTRMSGEAAERLLDYAAKSIDTAPPTTETVRNVLGREALTFGRWARDHAESFV